MGDEDLYPSPPADVPADLTRPTRAYRLHAWLASLALLLFVALYVGLIAWFGTWGLRLLSDAASLNARIGAVTLLSFPLLFFCAFLIAGLFVPKAHIPAAHLEITARDEPRLFEFLHRIAAEVRAPRPHRVFLSPAVNAG